MLLRKLWDEGGAIRDAIRHQIDHLISHVVPDHVADAVLADLDAIAVEELWDRSGDSALGYVHPADESWQIVKERLEPYVGGLNRYTRLGKLEESLLYCAGVLEGIYLFGNESDTDFLKWAVDDPREAFHWVLDEWRRAVPDATLRTRMRDELEQRCPKWQSAGL